MKHIIISILILSIIFCSSKKEENKNSKKVKSLSSRPPLPTTLLDSLQGTWVRDDDSNSIAHINGRSWIDTQKDTNSNISIVYNSLVYFSDTALKFNDTEDFNAIRIMPIFDTTLTTGKYIIFKNIADNYIECYTIEGYSTSNTDTTFSFHPVKYWKASSVIVYRKK